MCVCVIEGGGHRGYVSWKKRQLSSPEPGNSCELPEGQLGGA